MTRDDDIGCMSLSPFWACASEFPLLKKTSDKRGQKLFFGVADPAINSDYNQKFLWVPIADSPFSNVFDMCYPLYHSNQSLSHVFLLIGVYVHLRKYPIGKYCLDVVLSHHALIRRIFVAIKVGCGTRGQLIR